MEKKFSLLGFEHYGKTALVEALMDKLDPSIIIVNENDLIEYNKEGITYPDVKPFMIRPLPKFSMYGEKIFICKGKHQYRKVKEPENNKNVWQCQCGKKI